MWPPGWGPGPYLRSVSDADTHKGVYSATTSSVHAHCGLEFQPLKRTHRVPIVLTPTPPDPEQICPACRLKVAR